MRLKIYLVYFMWLLANSVFAQSAKMTDPDILGIHIGMTKSAALNIIKEKFPKTKFTPHKKDVATNIGELIYDGQYTALLGNLKASTSQDKLTISFLPDDTVIAIKREINYYSGKQKRADILSSIVQKYGQPVYYVDDDTTRFADQSMWSDTMLPGLSLIGSSYVQGGKISTNDFGTVTPYPFCKAELDLYTWDQFTPNLMYRDLTSNSDYARKRTNFAKTCGKTLWVFNQHETPLHYNAVKTEIYLADLAKAPDLILELPEMVKKNSNTIFFKPITQMPKPSANTPNF